MCCYSANRQGVDVLLRFEVSNYRSILDSVSLSLIAIDADRASAWEVPGFDQRVLSTAGIYGANASGKSNVLEALGWLSSAVRRSLRSWDQTIPLEPFRFGDGPSRPTEFEVDLLIDSTRYTYRLEVNENSVLFEALYSYPERRRRVLFERVGTDLRVRRGLARASAIRELLTPTTLTLSVALRFGDPELGPVAQAMAGIQAIGLERRAWGRPSFGLAHSTQRWFEDRPLSLFEDADDFPSGGRASALAMLRLADLGIDDVEITEEVDDLSPDAERPRLRRQLRLVHRGLGQQLSFDLADESVGTRTWFRLIGPTLQALRSGQILIVDEIDASLHPRLSAKLLELFQDPQTNPHRAQLVFTSHDTSLLNDLNRDEVWLTEKSSDGATSLTALADFGGDKVRRSLNLERAYLQGRFGAVPELEQSLVLEVMGLLGDAPQAGGTD